MPPVNSRDRVWAALTGRTPDRPPKGEILIEEAWLKSSGFQILEQAIQVLRADLAVLPVRSQAGTDWSRLVEQDVFLFGSVQGPVTFFTQQLGWHAFSKLIIKQPHVAQEILRQYIGGIVEQILSILDKGCDGIVVLDDLAGGNGLLVSPKFLQDVYFPLLSQALWQLGSTKVPVIFHSDGNIKGLIPMLKQAGFWGIQGLQPSVGLNPDMLDIEPMQNWVYWGNFEFEGLGRLKTVAEVESDVTALLKRWMRFPGYIFGSSGGLYKGLSLPEIKAAYYAIDNWRRKTHGGIIA